MTHNVKANTVIIPVRSNKSVQHGSYTHFNFVIHPFSTPPVNPILLEVPTDMNISLFENGMFTCKARGFPTPTVSWYRNGRHLDVNALDNVDITAVMIGHNTTSILTITNATYENSGKYFCSATSSGPAVIGVNCSEVDVIVRRKW